MVFICPKIGIIVYKDIPQLPEQSTTDTMTIDIKDFYKATNPARTLVARNMEDQKCYIDFSEVRGEDIISTIKDHID